MSIELERTDDILKLSVKEKTVNLSAVSLWKQKICLKIQERKLEKKNCDMIVANNLKQDGAGFGGNTNIVTLITKDDEVQLEKMTKDEVAEKIFDFILSR